jgi:hypothetical protein
VQISVVLLVRVTVRPLDDVAVTVYGDCAIVRVEGGEKVIVCEAKVMVIETVTGVAADITPFPAWLAVNVQVPVPVKYKTNPIMEQLPAELLITVTGRPLDDVAVNLIGDCSIVRVVGNEKAIV